MGFYRILLVCPETKKELAEAIREELEEGLFGEEHQVAVEWVKSETAAQARLADLQSHYHLIITSLNIPAAPKTPLKPDEQRGLSFLQSRNQEHLQIPSILVAPMEDEKLVKSLRKVDQSEVVLEGANLLNNLLSYSQHLLGKVVYRQEAPEKMPLVEEAAVKKKIMGNIDISLNLYNRMYVPSMGELVKGRYDIKPYGFNYIFPSGEIDLDFRTLRRLARKSKELEKESGWPEWNKILHDVGGTLKKQICDRNYQFQKQFLEIIELVKGIENTRIRFNLTFEDKETEDEYKEERTEDLHSILLEAMMDMDEREFLMLQAPICRRLDFRSSPFRSEFFPLFHENADPVINCLIIEAYTWGFPALKKDGKDVELKPLDHLKAESDWLEKNLGKIGQVRVGNICRISEDKIPPSYSFQTYCEKIIKEGRPWHLVHYAGHSLYDDEHVGYVFFPQEEDIKPVKIEVFSKDLRQAEPNFIYLSSCYSSGADFVFHLANIGIPAILGFRWSIEDEIAGECAQIFYQYLFTTKNLEEAFLKTRRDIHDKYEKNKIWAAPLLVYQTCS